MALAAVVAAVARTVQMIRVARAYLSGLIELCILPSMDLMPRKSCVQPNLWLINLDFLEEVMPILVPKCLIS